MSELIDAWSTWMTGARPASLWGLDIIWISRWGSIIQFIGGMMVLAEIVGVQRLNRLADSMRGTWRATPLRLFGVATCAVTAMVALSTLAAFGSFEDAICPPHGSAMCIFATLLPIARIFLLALLGAVIFPLFYMGVRLFGMLLSSAKTERPFKVVSVILITVGFSFSLLAA